MKDCLASLERLRRDVAGDVLFRCDRADLRNLPEVTAPRSVVPDGSTGNRNFLWGKQVRDRNLVLVVDDDPGMLEGLERLLRQLGYASLLFPSAEAFADHDDFDNAVCILLDIDLGGVSGIELRYGLKERNIAVPVIFMTGHDNVGVRETAHQSGCLAYLVKPFTAVSLSELLGRARKGA